MELELEESDFMKWVRENRFVFHWKFSTDGDGVFVISAFCDLPEKQMARHLASNLRRRGVDCHCSYRSLSVSGCQFSIFLNALKATKITWDEFKSCISFLHFDGSDHIPDKEVPPFAIGA